MIEHFHLLRPLWLLALIPWGLLLWRVLRSARISRSWQSVVDPLLLPHLLAAQPGTRNNGLTLLLGLASLIGIIALAGPTWEKLPRPIFQQQSALVIALDLSRSMDVTDIKPSRLTRARHKIADILSLRREGQSALITYAASAFVVTPLTEDADTINALLSSLTTDMMPTQGSRADRALLQAYSLIKNAGVRDADLLLVTDGFTSFEADAVTALMRQHPNVRLSILMAGSEQGGPIPLPGGGFLKDQQGAIVIARTSIDQLRSVVSTGAGSLQTITNDDQDIQRLLNHIQRTPLDSETIASDRRADIWREQGPLLLLLLLPFVALVFRRGLLLLLLIGLFPFSPESEASGWQSLWQNHDQRARQQFEAGEHPQAAELFDDPQWKASSWYRAGEYEKALQYWNQSESESAQYNRGNTLANLGRYQEAIDAYEQVLKNNPEHPDAQSNKQIVEQALQQQQQQAEGQDQQSGDSESDSEQQTESEQQSQSEQTQADQAQQDSESQQSSQQDQADQQNPSGQQNQMQQSDQEDASSEAEQQQTENDTREPAQSEENLEQQQALNQWLRKIPDDPGGLLRRKFIYQYRNRNEVEEELQSW